MRESLTQLLRAADVPSLERAETLWAEYRSGGPDAEAAFTTLVAWYGLAIYRRIWGFVRSDAAEDVFQDVLAKLHRERRHLDSFEHALRWLRVVAVRQCVDAHRRAARRKARERRTTRPDGEAPADERFELQEIMAIALAKLSPRHREAVALVFFEGMNKQDAAKVLGINRDTLAVRLNVALSRLQKLIPAPAMLAAGGTVAIPVELSARSPVLSAARLGEVVKSLFARAATSGSRLGRLVWIALGLAGVSGVALAAWPRPEPGPALLTAMAPEPPTAPVESVPDRNLRIFRAEVLPRQQLALRGLLLGDGKVILKSARAHDVRVQCVFELQHRRDGVAGPVSRISFIHNSWNRSTHVYFDLYGRGEEVPIRLDKPIILGRNPFNLAQVAIRPPALEEAVAAFGPLPRDALTGEAAAADLRRLARALAPLLGRWYINGNPDDAVDLVWKADSRLGYWPTVPGTVGAATDLADLWVDPDGRVYGVPYARGPMTLSPNGRRVRFGGSNDWWSRDPIFEP
jgi:RNA polymerase sigma-70 factor (ECF subfamily)